MVHCQILWTMNLPGAIDIGKVVVKIIWAKLTGSAFFWLQIYLGPEEHDPLKATTVRRSTLHVPRACTAFD